MYSCFHLRLLFLYVIFSSVERVVEYLELPQEPPLAIENSRPPAFWPSGSNNDSLIDVKDLVIVCKLFSIP